MLAKDDAEHPVPPEWHPIFRTIVDAFVVGDYDLSEHPAAGVSAIDPATAHSIAANVSAYGAALAPLHPSVWERAVYRWMGDHWLALVDLTTTVEPVSDLTLHAKLNDTEGPGIEILSVHVP